MNRRPQHLTTSLAHPRLSAHLRTRRSARAQREGVGDGARRHEERVISLSSSLANASGERRDQGRARSTMTHPAASIAGHDAPPIGERAATRGRSATEGGDERAGAKSAIRSQQCAPCRRSKPQPPRRTTDYGRARSSMTYIAPASPATTRRSSANARDAWARRNRRWR
jgi:hypothetical protein